ncbi:MAG: hypothetical protein CVV31_03525 [Methanomicrobiales archaeon HGW-Methanomicrobiales-2]|jgi:hypothetical protein|nr:hypothetical protein [Methanoculleus sp.]PKL62893.1 MAG: hypothetical protein CVV31_03525 [Methanomicrobiales archaeon HGW-Methanomicrobiales-2]
MIEGPSQNKQKKIIALAICIVFAAAGILSISVLIYDPGPPAVSLPQNIYGTPLSGMWAIIEEWTGIENTTAVLGDLTLVATDDGSIKSLHMSFYGDNEDLHQFYRIRVSPMSIMTWDSWTVDRVPVGEHPLVLLSEIERIPYRKLTGENTGLIIEVDAQYGDLAYEAWYRSLFALHRGEVVPLERVAFSTNDPWYDIAVFNRTSDGSTGISGGPAPGESSHCCTLFTLRDLGKAETVEYRDAESLLHA